MAQQIRFVLPLSRKEIETELVNSPAEFRSKVRNLLREAVGAQQITLLVATLLQREVLPDLEEKLSLIWDKKISVELVAVHPYYECLVDYATFVPSLEEFSPTQPPPPFEVTCTDICAELALWEEKKRFTPPYLVTFLLNLSFLWDWRKTLAAFQPEDKIVVKEGDLENIKLTLLSIAVGGAGISVRSSVLKPIYTSDTPLAGGELIPPLAQFIYTAIEHILPAQISDGLATLAEEMAEVLLRRQVWSGEVTFPTGDLSVSYSFTFPAGGQPHFFPHTDVHPFNLADKEVQFSHTFLIPFTLQFTVRREGERGETFSLKGFLHFLLSLVLTFPEDESATPKWKLVLKAKWTHEDVPHEDAVRETGRLPYVGRVDASVTLAEGEVDSRFDFSSFYRVITEREVSQLLHSFLVSLRPWEWME